MKIVARTQIGREFVYSTASAHSVSERSAETICNILNEYKYHLNDGECWFIYDIDRYDRSYDFACFQYFKIRKGVVSEVKH